jgi:hypothetical protein
MPAFVVEHATPARDEWTDAACGKAQTAPGKTGPAKTNDASLRRLFSTMNRTQN